MKSSFAPDPPPPRALEGVRVLDLATFIAAPFCAGLLSEFGAEVIKVEQPGSGDPVRDLGEKFKGQGLFWALEDRGRRSVTCNLRLPRGQELALGLARESDIVVENFRPGTLERWNLGYERLRSANPGVVLVSISAFGQSGPYAARPGFGRIAQAFGGLTYLAGYPDRPPVNPGSATLADYAAGLFGAVAALAAFRHRERTGQGQQIDVSLYESIFRLTDVMALEYGVLGLVRERQGSQAHAAPHNHYPTADGKWLAIACTNDRMFRRLAEAMGQPDWAADPNLERMEQRASKRAEVDERVAAWTGRHNQAELCRLLDLAEVPNSPINSVADCFADPHYAARGTLMDFEDQVLGRVKMHAPVPRLSETPAAVERPAPTVGQHNAEVYGAVLGLDAAALDRLRADGVI
jgi:crotonobetainyl-CoA:carnitine CoA-transferase CaiB-like acyl-CoA transferase